MYTSFLSFADSFVGSKHSVVNLSTGIGVTLPVVKTKASRSDRSHERSEVPEF